MREGYTPEPYLEIVRLYTIYYNELPADYRLGGESHPFWELLYIDKGTAVCTAREHEYTMRHGSILLHMPNEYHDIRADEKDPPNVVVVTFDCGSDSMRALCGMQCVLPQTLRYHIAEILRNARATFVMPMKGTLTPRPDPLPGGAQMIKLHLEQLLIELIRRDESAPSRGAPGAVRDELSERCIQYLERHVYGSVTIAELCAAVGYSRTQLCTRFRKVTGYSVLDYYAELKLAEAKRLLRHENRSAAEVSALLGFASPSYFSRFFARLCGMTPLQYRTSQSDSRDGNSRTDSICG